LGKLKLPGAARKITEQVGHNLKSLKNSVDKETHIQQVYEMIHTKVKKVIELEERKIPFVWIDCLQLASK